MSININILKKKTDKANQAAHATIKTRRKFVRNHIWIYPPCIIALYFLSACFIYNPVLRITASILLAIPFFSALVHVLYQKRASYLRSQCKVLFQSLCTSVSGGYSLESAFLASRAQIESVFGKKSVMSQALRRMESERAAQISFSHSLSQLCFYLDYLEILPIMQALSITRIVGNGVISILRSSQQMLAELISVKNEVDANNAGKNAEALMLCLMPFGITITLTSFTGDYMTVARNTTMGTIMMLAAFSLSVISCGFLLSLIGESRQKAFKRQQNEKMYSFFPDKASENILKILKKILPESFISGEYERAIEMGGTPDQILQIKIKKVSLLLIFSFVFSITLLHITDFPLWFCIPFILLVLFFFQIDDKQKAIKRRECIMEEIPLFLAILTTLLQSGVMLQKAIQICAGAFPVQTVLGSEIFWLNKQIESGSSAAQAVDLFSSRTPIPEAQAALILCSKYDRSGGTEVLQLLQLQANACWSLCRNASRKRKERDAVKMILPMMLDLTAVLLVVITPAFISMQV